MSNCQKYNCYGVYDTSLCYGCVHNQESEEKKEKDNYISQLDKLVVLFEFLTGEKLPEGVTCSMPKLPAKKAFSVIWFLQEIMRCLPDNIEKCDGCDVLYDADQEGFCLDDQYMLDGKMLPKKYWGHWCAICVPCVNFNVG